MTLVELTRGDRNYYLQFHLRDAEDKVVDLSEGTILPKIKVQRYGEPNLLFSKEGEVTNGPEGVVRFRIENEFLNQAGDFIAEIELNFLDRVTILTFPEIFVHVTKDLPR